MKTLPRGLNGSENVAQACFECGIKLATIYHQFIGTPVSPKSKNLLCKAIEEAIRNQPFVEDVKVEIRIEDEFKFKSFKYKSLDYKMIKARVKVRVGNVICIGRLEYDEEKDFALMSIEKIYTIKKQNNCRG